MPIYREVTAEGLRDRIPAAVLGGTGIGLLSLAAVVLYESFGIDSNIAEDLPDALTSLLGIDASVNYVMGEMFGLLAPIFVLVVAISAGVAAIAGEEHDGTANLLFTHPVTRRGVVASKALSLVALVVVACVLFLAGALLAGVVVDVGTTTADIVGTAVMLAAFGVAFAMIALALSSGTGSRSTALGAAAALAVGAYLVKSLFPLVHGLEDLARLSPWHYYDGSAPLANGIDFSHLGVLVVIGLAGFVVAILTIEQRDISSGAASRRFSLTGRLEVFGRLTRPRVGGLFGFALWRRSSTILIASGALGLFAVAVGAMYPGLRETLTEAFSNLPEAFGGFVGSTDLASPQGWVNGELFSITAPAVVIGVSSATGADALAGEIRRRHMVMVLSAPVERSSVVVVGAAVVLVAAVSISAFTGLGLAVGSPLGGMDLDMGGVTAACAQLALLGTLFGVCSLALGAWFSSRVAVGGAIGLALVSYLAQSLLSLGESTEAFAALSPWHYYSGNDPLVNGFDIRYLVVLGALSGLALGVAVVGFGSRDAAS